MLFNLSRAIIYNKFSMHVDLCTTLFLSVAHMLLTVSAMFDAKKKKKKKVQLRYAEGVKDMLDRYFKGEDFPVQNYIVKEGQLASQYQ